MIERSGLRVINMRALLSFFMLIAVAVVVKSEEKWWSAMSLYQIYPRSFKDSNGDGIGDLKGIIDNLDHLVESKVTAMWMSPIYPSPGVDMGYDISNFIEIDPLFGTLEDFDILLEKAHKTGLKVLMDFVPNHSSDQHEWFQKSVKDIPPYNNYYVWANGTFKAGGTRAPPNNWVSVFGGPAWTWNDQRQAYYLHQFTPQQPDLNYRYENLRDEIKNVLRFWLDRGVDGFRIDVINHVFEIQSLQDEPLSGNTNDPNNYGYLNHIYTKDQPECYELVRQWRELLDEYNKDGEHERLMVLEAYTDINLTMKYYKFGASFPFNFGFIQRLNADSSPADVKFVIDEWMARMPDGNTANWVIGNHDQKRVASRYGVERAQGIIALLLLLPGVLIMYNGDEIGMPNNYVSWEQGKDPQGCNAGREGFEAASRDPFRTPFLWDGTTSAGFSTNPNTWLPVNPDYKSLNLEVQKEAGDSQFKFYQTVAELRSWPTAQSGDLYTYVISDNIFAISRILGGQRSIYLVLNFGNELRNEDLTRKIENIPGELIIYRGIGNSDLPYGSIIDSKSAQIPARGAVIYVTPEMSRKFEVKLL
ncbi:alpha-glucosidase [Diachasma alloeum]|uniref:alpha-glucosidase n=1 Tax=Diachasma alloeum TaxID=454923 RepID=UPI0007381A92|nr:alpha-glucosidase [Diachasma alloeum]XP_015112565.1 alpha-glucosidase [Diachasma alloeum]